MSAIEEAKAATAASKGKTYEDVYRGGATVKEVNPMEPRFTDGLTEEEASAAFDIQIIVTPDDANVPEQEIMVPYSARVLKFAPDKTEAQRAVDDLTKQGLVRDGDISTVFSAVGKKVQINAYKETSSKGTFDRCRFNFGQKKLSQSDIMKRIAAMTGKAPAAQAKNANPFG